MNKKFPINYPIDKKTADKIKNEIEKQGMVAQIDERFNLWITSPTLNDSEVDAIVENTIISSQKIKMIDKNDFNKMVKRDVSLYGYNLSEDGVVYLKGHALNVYNEFKDIFEELKKCYNAELLEIPYVIGSKELRKIKYNQQFPDNYTEIKNTSHSETIEYSVLPAACFHTYKNLENINLKSKKLVGTLGKCLRNEEKKLISEYRLTYFTMSEIVTFGTFFEVEETRKCIMDRVWNLFNLLGLRGRIETASDPFFNSDNKKKYQLDNEIKYELIYELKGEDFSVASFNIHEKFFTSKYNIKLLDNLAFSGCNAFGIERWVYAFLLTYGDEKLPKSFKYKEIF
ncbi:hypothetical protein [Lysinibacillus sp. NPDC093692]|uniref:hypothetical protein n=1 Tax=Lysinibacillus sp. NPDC093692 TaxID=3390578 RepID=UPI003D0268C0